MLQLFAITFLFFHVIFTISNVVNCLSLEISVAMHGYLASIYKFDLIISSCIIVLFMLDSATL